MLFDIKEQDSYYRRHLKECEEGWWLSKNDLLKKLDISYYTLKKVIPAIEELDNSYELIFEITEREKKYHYGRIAQFIRLYNKEKKKGA